MSRITNLLDRVQSLYDYLLECSPEQKDACSREETDSVALPKVRLRIRSKAVEGAYETGIKFFTTDNQYLPATVLPQEHRETVVKLMNPPNGTVTSFRLVQQEKPGSTTIVWDLCVYDEQIDTRK